ncbi:hypothetical protein [uncultured Xanthomonas sp.]|uniref:hypothetical protein n=1 Tax=uncultured Xanthomonas sp. TaxID=152831 RepID=UPI0025CD758A|nr:hypothetical protein [uncultured Xanthomonas sp.]
MKPPIISLLMIFMPASALAISPGGDFIGLGEAIGAARDLLDGKVRGRLVVDVNR